MPSTSKEQQHTMSAIAHGWKPPAGSKVARIPKKVATEFHKADLTKGDHLKKLYAGGSFSSRKKNFDGGGSYASYPSYASASPNATYMAGSGSGAPTAAEIAALTGANSGTVTSNDSATGQPNAYAPGTGTGVNSPLNIGPTTVSANLLTDAQLGNTSSSSGASTGALGSLLKALGLGGSSLASQGGLTALAGLLGAAGQYKQNAAYAPTYNPPALFGGQAGTTGVNGSAGGYGPSGGYNFRNYQGVGATTPGLGYAPRTAVTPNIPNYYTYGQGGEQPFYTGTSAQIPAAKRGGRIMKKAEGGAVLDTLAKAIAKYAGKASDAGNMAAGAFDHGMDYLFSSPRTSPTLASHLSSIGQAASPGNWADRMDVNYQDLIDRLNSSPWTKVSPGDNNLNNLANPFPGGLNARSPGGYARGGSTTPPRFDAGGSMALPGPSMGGMPVPGGGMGRPMAPPTMPQAPGPLNGGPMPARPQIAPPRGPQPRPMGPPMASTQPMRPQVQTPMMRAEGGATDPSAGALSSVARHVKGPGDGTSDSIPARLANGEYVMDAQTVSMLGNGDNGAGAKQLDSFRENVRKHKGEALAKGKMAPDAHPNLMRYLGGKVNE
jgi:hypothetical protein